MIRDIFLFIAGIIALCAIMFFGLRSIDQARSQNIESVRVFGALDGDTIRTTELCRSEVEGKFWDIRVYGIDTPEKRSTCAWEARHAIKATEYVRTLIKRGDVLQVAFQGYDKYACRYLAKVTLPDGSDLAAAMIAKGFARPYYGDKKQPWCK